MNKIIIVLAMAGAFSQFESLAMMSQLGADASTKNQESCWNAVQKFQASYADIEPLEATVPNLKLGANTYINNSVVQLWQEIIPQFGAIVPSSTIAQSYMGKVPKRVYWTEEKKLRLVEYVKKHIVDKHVRWTNVYHYFPSKDPKAVESYFWKRVYGENKEELQELLGRGTKGRKQGVVRPVSVYKKEQVVAQKVAVMKPVVNVKSLDDIVKQDQEADVSKLMTEFVCTQTLDE